MSPVDRVLFRPVSTLRPYLMAKGVLLVLALDCIVELVSHGGRYGVGGFNVAHFALLDRLLPLPTPALYVGTLFTCSALAFVLVLGQLRRSLLVVLTTLYTLAWSSSLLDAYQHHYLLSLLLASMCTFPETKLRDLVPSPHVEHAHATPHRRTHGRRHHETSDAPATPRERRGAIPTHEAPGFVSFLVTCSIVYAFTAVMKLDPDWRSGSALSRIVETSTLYPLMITFGRLGLSESEWYLWLARGAIAIQGACALAFVAAIFADAAPRGRRLATSLLLVAPLVFHASAEAMDLEIGWFSQYMALIACVALLPDEVLRVPIRLVARFRGLGRSEALGAPPPNLADDRFGRMVFALLAGMLVPIALASADLPGTIAAGIVAAGLVLAVFAIEELRSAGSADDLPIALALAGILCFACVAYPRLGIRTGDVFRGVEASSVRYDYYRFVAGDMRRRHDTDGAIAAYRKAFTYAPTDELRESALRKIERLRRGE